MGRCGEVWGGMGRYGEIAPLARALRARRALALRKPAIIIIIIITIIIIIITTIMGVGRSRSAVPCHVCVPAPRRGTCAGHRSVLPRACPLAAECAAACVPPPGVYTLSTVSTLRGLARRRSRRAGTSQRAPCSTSTGVANQLT